MSDNAGALFYSRETNRFLFLRRASDKRHKGTWGIVGGRLENNEDVYIGLRREVFEEIGLELDENALIIPLTVYVSETNNFTYQTFVIVVENEFIPKLNVEHSGYAWTKVNEFPKPLHPGVWKTVNFSEVVEKLGTIETLFSKVV